MKGVRSWAQVLALLAALKAGTFRELLAERGRAPEGLQSS